MAHTQKQDFVFRRNGRVYLNRRRRQFSLLLAAEVCTSAFIVGSNAGYTMFRGSVKGTGYQFHSLDSPSPPLPGVTVCHHHISTGVYHCLLSYGPATDHNNGQIRVLPGSRPVNSQPAKRPGCVNRPMLFSVPLFCPVIIRTCRPVETRNV